MMFFKVRSKIIFTLLFTLLVLWFLFYIWINRRQETIMLNYLKHQAEGIYNTVILSRHWIASKGGIYVKMEGGGYKLITPSHFVAELTDFAKEIFPYKIKIAVLNSENPDHIPDQFEVEAINKIWKEKRRNYWKLVSTEEGKIFRFAAPLKFKSECQYFHFDYTEKTKGCVSVSFPATSVYRELMAGKIYMALFSILSLGFIFVVIYLLLNRLVLKPLKEFTTASEAVEAGNLNVRVNIDSKDEWGILAKRFNSMIEKIAAHQKELENKVKKATAELQKAYEELKQTERFKSEFFSNVTHDLKTPITAIKGAADLLIRKESNPYGQIIMKNVEKLSRMINDILDCTKLEYGQFELKKEKEDITDLIEDAIFTVSPLAMEKGINISFKNSLNGNSLLWLDRSKLSRAVVNILTNAIKFSPPNSSVNIEVKEKDNSIHISIEDYGPGIPDEEKDKVFQKFYKNSNDGMGLGLFIAKGIVEAHGGKIWISKPGHRGTIFNILIPRGEDESQNSHS